MASIKLKHSGGNGVIIAAPTSNPASDKTLTLPSDVDGTVVSKDSSNSLQNITGVNGGQLGNRNLIINGAMQVAQRGTSSTSGNYATVDRFKLNVSGTDEAPTQAQVDVGSSDLPFTKGLTKAYKITNGNQTSGAGSSDRIVIQHRLEAQDIRNSGWNYTSTSSYVTLSFYVKSSVAQNFFGKVKTSDGTAQNYPFETGSLSADTWTKITKTIPGNSNLQFDNNNAEGLSIEFTIFRGTDETGSVTLNQWAAFSSSTHTPDNTSTWYTTNDATFEITGVQLEVGDTATDFEHRSFGQELQLCRRYYILWIEGDQKFVCFGDHYSATQVDGGVQLPVEMRTTPTIDANTGGNYYIVYSAGGSCHIDGSLTSYKTNKNAVLWYATGDSSRTPGHANRWVSDNASAKIAFSAEL